MSKPPSPSPSKAKPKPKPVAEETAKTHAHALNLDIYAPAYLARLAGRMSGGASRVYLKIFGIGVNEWRILSMLAIKPGATVQWISEAIDIDKASTSRSIKTLVTQGYVRAGDTRSSQRNRPFVLTERGEVLHDDILKIALRREQILLEGFAREERTMLMWMFQRLVRNLDSVEAHDTAAILGGTAKGRR